MYHAASSMPTVSFFGCSFSLLFKSCHVTSIISTKALQVVVTLIEPVKSDSHGNLLIFMSANLHLTAFSRQLQLIAVNETYYWFLMLLDFYDMNNFFKGLNRHRWNFLFHPSHFIILSPVAETVSPVSKLNFTLQPHQTYLWYSEGRYMFCLFFFLV